MHKIVDKVPEEWVSQELYIDLDTDADSDQLINANRINS